MVRFRQKRFIFEKNRGNRLSGSGGQNHRKLILKINTINLHHAVILTSQNLRIDCLVFIRNRTVLVRFGGISGEFGRAMVRILVRRSRAKIPMAIPNEPDILQKRTKKRCH